MSVQILVRTDEAINRLRSGVEMARQIIKARTKATNEILNTLDGRTSPIIASPDEAKAIGLVKDIIDLGQKGAGGMPVAIWTASVA